MTASERKEQDSRFRYEIERALRDSADLNTILYGGKKYRLIENPVLTKADKAGVCSIYGFVEVRK